MDHWEGSSCPRDCGTCWPGFSCLAVWPKFSLATLGKTAPDYKCKRVNNKAVMCESCTSDSDCDPTLGCASYLGNPMQCLPYPYRNTDVGQRLDKARDGTLQKGSICK